MTPSRQTEATAFDHVSVEDVSRHFGRRRALAHVTCTIPGGTILGLLGPNGAGKSTLLSILASLLRPSAGTVNYGSFTVGPGNGGTSSAWLRSHIGVLGHDLFLYPELTARENLTFFAGVHGLGNPGARALEALTRAGLADRADDHVSEFSRGMRQRVALERALIHDPRLVLLDEPFTGLDDASAAGFVARLQALRHGGAIVVLATHDLDLADGLLDQALFLRNGRAVDAVTNPDGLRAAYRSVIGRQV